MLLVFIKARYFGEKERQFLYASMEFTLEQEQYADAKITKRERIK
ncbi:hypothetical protein LJR015_002808 [Peribacillus frigoritolerans]|nr:hypothetical protein [Bacillus sp. SD075]